MKSNETKINIDVNIYGTRFSVVVPFSKQDAVRATETQMKAYLKSLKETHPTRSLAECMAMMAYHYASNLFAVNARYEADRAEAEELLRDAAKICGEDTVGDTDNGSDEFSEFGEY
ncbi:MAG: cell division protein ZapA [Muribaculaceae bacterium]|nr:cell division protein ZapA [Muribaculaceae bacterium]